MFNVFDVFDVLFNVLFNVLFDVWAVRYDRSSSYSIAFFVQAISDWGAS